jgi:hypothetical protein
LNLRQTFWKWAAIGLVVGGFLVWAQANAVGGPAGMLQVGETSALRPIIEEQLGDIPLAEGPGHDGQIFYAIGVDLRGDRVGPLLDDAGYRYRRILMPLVASMLGLLDGQALLMGQIVVGLVSMSLAAGLVAAMSAEAGRSDLWALTVVLNPGVWLSVQLLTSDAMSLALMVLGLYFYVRRRDRSSGAWFALAGLAKDVILITPLSIGLRDRRRTVLLIPAVVLFVWMLGLTVTFGTGFNPRGNLAWPFMGIIRASSNWAHLDLKESVYVAVALGFVVIGAVWSLRRSWLRWPIVAWTVLALVSSNWVWDFGNNAVRAFAPIVVLVALAGSQPTPTSVPRKDKLALAGS